MLPIKAILRQLLARRGYVLRRMEPEVPPSLAACLQTIRSRPAGPASVVCFDNDVAIQSELLKVFSADQTCFSSPLFAPATDAPALGTTLPAAPAAQFLVVIDLETFPLVHLAAKCPWLKQAEVLLLRARLGSFWAGEADLARLKPGIEALGFQLADVLNTTPDFHVPQAPAGSVLLICERASKAPAGSHGQHYRTLEALTYLSAPVVSRQDFQLLTGRGSFGFAAGMYNPGAIAAGEHNYLLAKADRTPWALQKTDESLFFASAQPWLLSLTKNQQLASADGLTLHGLPGPARAEDFRLFQYRGEVFSNHAVIGRPSPSPATHQPLQIEQMQTRIGISRLNLPEKSFTWCGTPTVDLPLNQTEKNWAMFTDGARLFLLYSFSPYILLTAQNWPELTFSTQIKKRVPLPFEGDGLSVRNSINPVPYDDGHWLHVVHKVYPGKQYAFWAVLISQQTRLPVRVSARPLVRGWHSFSASIIYACSVIVDPKNVLLFAGLDDSAMAVATIPRQRLDAEWINLPAGQDCPL